MPATPPPPQLSPVPGHEAEHITVWPQLLLVMPHLSPMHVVACGSSVQAAHWPIVASQPLAHGIAPPHCPSGPQVCDMLPLQRWVLGTQKPPQRPVV
jgi:hypothetical protein